MTTPAPLSPDAQELMNKYLEAWRSAPYQPRSWVAAALRAIAARSEAVEIRTAPGMSELDEVIRVSDLLAIATELDGGAQ